MKKVKVRRTVKIPLKYGDAKFISFHHLADQKEHLVIALGDYKKQTVTNVRIHSECLTGEIFHSSKCDCGEQLDESLKKFQAEGGLLIYLRQEGRGIGLYNKLDAYHLQNLGLDTVEANEALGFNDDLREYKVAAEMLLALGIKKINLFSNNPSKKQGLEKNGVQVVSQRPTGIHANQTNIKYLETKVRKSGHLINLSSLMSYASGAQV